MAKHICPDVFIYVCHNCIPGDGRLPRQWKQDDVHVQVKELPCTGKMNTQYLFHALEGGSRGICVVTCPHGECTLSQGNYRAEIRVNNVRRLLQEIGLESERVKIFQCSPDDPSAHLENQVKEAVKEFSALGVSPILT